MGSGGAVASGVGVGSSTITTGVGCEIGVGSSTITTGVGCEIGVGASMGVGSV